MKPVASFVGMEMAGVLLGGTAEAMTWSSQSSPLTAKDGSKVVASAYGDFFNRNGQYAESMATRKANRTSNRGAYVETEFLFHRRQYDGKTCFAGFEEYGVTKQTSRNNSTTWKTESEKVALKSDGTQARGNMKVCEDIAWSWDKCSNSSIIRTFSY